MAYKGGRLLAPALADVGKIGALIAQRRAATGSSAKAANTWAPKKLAELSGEIEFTGKDYEDSAIMRGIQLVTEKITQNERDYANNLIPANERDSRAAAALIEAQSLINGFNRGAEEYKKQKEDKTVHPITFETYPETFFEGVKEDESIDGFKRKRQGTYYVDDDGSIMAQEYTTLIDPKTGQTVNQLDINRNVIQKRDLKNPSYILNRDFVSRDRKEVISDLQERFGSSGYKFEIDPSTKNRFYVYAPDSDEGVVFTTFPKGPSTYRDGKKISDRKYKKIKERFSLDKEDEVGKLRFALGDQGHISNGFIGADGNLIKTAEQVRMPNTDFTKIPMHVEFKNRAKNIFNFGSSVIKTVPIKEDIESFSDLVVDRYDIAGFTQEPVQLKGNYLQYMTIADKTKDKEILGMINTRVNKYGENALLVIGYDLGMRGEFSPDADAVLGGFQNMTEEEQKSFLKEKFSYLKDENQNTIEVNPEDLIYSYSKNRKPVLNPKQRKIAQAELRHQYAQSMGRSIEDFKIKETEESSKEDEIKSAQISSSPLSLPDMFLESEKVMRIKQPVEYQGTIRAMQDLFFTKDQNDNLAPRKADDKSISIPSVMSRVINKSLEGFGTYRGQDLKQITNVVVRELDGKYYTFLVGPATLGQIEQEVPSPSDGPKITQRSQQTVTSIMSAPLSESEAQRVYETLYSNNDMFKAAANQLGKDFKTKNYGQALHLVFEQL